MQFVRAPVSAGRCGAYVCAQIKADEDGYPGEEALIWAETYAPHQ